MNVPMGSPLDVGAAVAGCRVRHVDGTIASSESIDGVAGGATLVALAGSRVHLEMEPNVERWLIDVVEAPVQAAGLSAGGGVHEAVPGQAFSLSAGGELLAWNDGPGPLVFSVAKVPASRRGWLESVLVRFSRRR